jgi:hypothetical protein
MCVEATVVAAPAKQFDLVAQQPKKLVELGTRFNCTKRANAMSDSGRTRRERGVKEEGATEASLNRTV